MSESNGDLGTMWVSCIECLPGETIGELFTLCLGKLAVQVFSLAVDFRRTFRVAGDVQPVQIWPVQHDPLPWPPWLMPRLSVR